MTTLQLLGNDPILRAQFVRYATQAPETALVEASAHAVVVTASASERPALIQQAARSARALLCPLPLASNVDETLALLHDCAAHDVRLVPIFPLRFIPVVNSLRESIRSGQLGSSLSIKVIYETRPTPASDGASLMAHEVASALDLLLWLTSAVMTNVHAERAGSHALLLSLALDSGAYALLDVARALPESYPLAENLRIEVIGTEGAAQASPFSQPIHTFTGQARAALWGTDPQRECFLDFVTTIAEEKEFGDALPVFEPLHALE